MFIRKVKTASGATAVQLARREQGKDVVVKHLGSAHNDVELALLLEVAKEKLLGGQLSLFSENEELSSSSIATVGAKSLLLYDTICNLYDQLGFSSIDSEIFKQLVVARLIEPTSKLDTIRVLSNLGLRAPSKNQINRLLPQIVAKGYRDILSEKCLKFAGKKGLSLLLYDVTTLYFEINEEDEFRKPGLSKERRLEPQIVIGLLVDRNGFPLTISEFEGKQPETKTIVTTVQAFTKKHRLNNLTVVADAAMLSSANLTELEKSKPRIHYIVGSRINKTPYDIELLVLQLIRERKTDEISTLPDIPDGKIIDSRQHFVIDGKKVKRRVVYQYKVKRAKLDLKNIEKQVEKANKVISGKAKLKKVRFLELKGATKSLNHSLIAESKLRAGWKGYVTDLPKRGKNPVSPQEVISYYHQLFQVEKSFRMSKSDLKARPIYHHKLDSIRAHITIVFAALAIARLIEDRTGISLRKFIHSLGEVRTATIRINSKTIDAPPVIPPPVENLLTHLQRRR